MKDKKSTSLKIKENITINFTGSTGPGLSWRYRIEVRLEKTQIEIWFSRDLDEYDLSIFSTIPKSSTFSDLVKTLDVIEGGIGGNLFNKIRCDGAPKPWDELLIMSLFSHIDEIRFDKVALALVEMDYEDIIKLHDRYGSFKKNNLVSLMLKISDYKEKLNFSSTREALEFLKIKEPSNLESFLKKLEKFHLKKEEKIAKELAIKKKLEDLQYSPYKKLGENIISNWELSNPEPQVRRHKYGMLGLKEKKKWCEKIRLLEKFIKSYAIKYKKLPSGIHNLDNLGELDFDSLKK